MLEKLKAVSPVCRRWDLFPRGYGVSLRKLGLPLRRVMPRSGVLNLARLFKAGARFIMKSSRRVSDGWAA